ncbi:MAG: DUF2167 domain-containing protein [Burkholderiaceae bacterium]|nr:DUF2167 domain-containing protein [Burkholderiaceae bacterium]
MSGFLRRTGGWLCAALLALTATLAHADAGSNRSSELESAWQAAKQTAQPGPATIKLRDQATLKLPADAVFIPQPAADQLMIAWGNGADPDMVGLIIPADENPGAWVVVASYEKSGYIRDDDAKDWKVDELLDSLKAGTTEQNKERARRGLHELELTGWIERPHYDAATHQLVWSMGARAKDAGADSHRPQTVNYNTYALGREGYISLNLLTDAQAVENDKPAVRALLGNLEFNQGKRYADFNASTDKVAAYGLAALVAGAAAKKLGLLAVLAAMFAKFAKVIVVAAIAVLYGVKKFFTGNGKPRPAPAIAAAGNNAPDKKAPSPFDVPPGTFDTPPKNPPPQT